MSAENHATDSGTGRNFEPPNKEQIDLLVDGELEDQGRKNLLRQLDRSPDGWKFCALAFLEAQMFQQAMCRERRVPATRSLNPAAAKTLSPFDAAPSETSSGDVAMRASIAKRKRPEMESRLRGMSRQLPTTIVTALVAFLLGGFVLSGFSNPFASSARNPVLVQAAPGVSMMPTTDHSVVEPVPVTRRDEYATVPVVDSPFVVVAPKKQLKNGPPRTEYVTLPAENGLAGTVIPCYLASEIQADQYLKSPALISANELSWIFPLGGEINVQRESYVVPAGENRHAIIPVDQVIVKYTPHVDLL